MARVDQNVLIQVGLVLVSGALFISSFAAAQEYEALYDDAAASRSGEFNYLDIGDSSPPIFSHLYVFPSNQSPESNEKLDECANKIKADNAEEILAAVFQSEPLTADSCRVLVHLGYDCHIRLVKALLSRPKLKEIASEALPKSVQIWKTCALFVEAEDHSVAPNPSPF